MEPPNISEKKIAAWIELLRAQKVMMNAIEAALKAASHPPLSWYDVLLELRNGDEAGLRPMELEKRLLLPQYGLSRLLDRMQKAGLVSRVKAPEDGRGQMIRITAEGRSVQAEMWPVYAAALKRVFADKLTTPEARQLQQVLSRFIDIQPG